MPGDISIGVTAVISKRNFVKNPKKNPRGTLGGISAGLTKGKSYGNIIPRRAFEEIPGLKCVKKPSKF